MKMNMTKDMRFVCGFQCEQASIPPPPLKAAAVKQNLKQNKYGMNTNNN